MVGQPQVVRSLQNALSSGKTTHAYLFTGPRGTGKTSAARILAKALCCEKGPAPEPCNECGICDAITKGSCVDVAEMDAASESGVEEVREAIVQVASYVPAAARYRVFIIDEVHDLSGKAFDALLKTVEEPPAHLVFILATTEYNKVPPTIRSRCQKYEFHRGMLSDLVARLEHVASLEGIDAEASALTAIARMADGAYRDALNLLELADLTSDGPITLEHVYDQLGLIDESAVDELLWAIRNGETAKVIDWLEGAYRRGRDPGSILESTLYRLADLTRAVHDVESATRGDGARSAAQHEAAARLGETAILDLRSALSAAHREVRSVSLPMLWLESELIRLARAQSGSESPETIPRRQPASPEPSGDSKRKNAADPPSKAEPGEDQQTVAAPADAGKAPEAESTEGPDDSPDPELRRAREAWAAVVATIQETSPNKAIAHKLLSASVVAYEGGKVNVEFARQIDRDGILEGPNGPQRQEKLLSLLREKSGEQWEIVYSVATRATNGGESATVELPAEGQKLLELARDVFSSG